MAEEENVFLNQMKRLAAQGSLLITEVQKDAKSYIPSPYLVADSAERRKYAPLIFDFTYFSTVDEIERKIKSDMKLLELNDELRDMYINYLERFYSLFFNITEYIENFNSYLAQLDNGDYVQYNFQDVVMKNEGKQLIGECLYLYAVMLMMVDDLMPGIVRETIIVSYYRYRGGATISKITEINKLFIRTEDQKGKRPENYPIQYFNRVPVNVNLIKKLITEITVSDIYDLTKAFPEHKTVALSTQANIIVMLLYFCPSVLQNEIELMKSIVEKHFSDNWVIAVYQGYVYDLVEIWDCFKDAKKIINHYITAEKVKQWADFYSNEVASLNKELQLKVAEGALTEEKILDGTKEILKLLRSANACMRWVILHRKTKLRKFREIIASKFNDKDIFNLMLLIGDYEAKFKEILRTLVKNKHARLDQLKQAAYARIFECAEFFAGNRNLGVMIKETKDERLENGFRNIAQKINDIDLKHSHKAGKMFLDLLDSLKKMTSYSLLQNNPQTKFYVNESVEILTNMYKISAASNRDLISLEFISDFSYAWNLLDEFLPLMHSTIRMDTKSVLLLKHLVMKLVSLLTAPLNRIYEANSEFSSEVERYYSKELVIFVTKVIGIIPSAIFGIINHIKTILSKQKLVKIDDTKIQADQLCDYLLKNERFELSKKLHHISVYSQGMLNMNKILMGVIEIDPHEFLVNGIRNDLCKMLSYAIHNTLVFTAPGVTFSSALATLSNEIENLRNSLEYVQDILGIRGLQIWYQELRRIIEANVKIEAGISRKIEAEESGLMKNICPIPRYEPLDKDSMTFMGRLLKELTKLTKNPKNIYIPMENGWYDTTTKEVVIDIKKLKPLQNTLGTPILEGLNQLICYKLNKKLRRFSAYYELITKPGSDDIREYLSKFIDDLKSYGKFGDNIYDSFTVIKEIIEPQIIGFIKRAQNIGHLQLLRKLILTQLHITSRVESKALYSLVDSLNNIFVKKVSKFKREQDINKINTDELIAEKRKKTELEMKLISYVGLFSDSIGISNVLQKMFASIRAELTYFSAFIALATIFSTNQFTYITKFYTYMKKPKALIEVDGMDFLYGIATILHHAHYNYVIEYICFISQYIKSASSKESGKETKSYVLLESFIEDFCIIRGIDLQSLRLFSPDFARFSTSREITAFK